MAGIRDCWTENSAERERLAALVAKLTDDDLCRRLPNGWTIATTLVHLAFWDMVQIARIRKWRAEGVQASAMDVEAANAAVSAMAAALPVRSAADMAISAAEDLDREIESLPADLASMIEAAGHGRVIRRSLHRREHLNRVEQALGTNPE